MSCTSTVAVQRTSVVATRNDCERTVAVSTARLAAVANVQRPYTSLVRTGVPGRDGWAPAIAAVPDGARRVLQVLDWIGGQGPKPATGYIGAAGIVADIANATDFRGGSGQDGEDGANGAGVPAGGALGQVLRKASTADNDTHWHTLTAADVTGLDTALAGKAADSVTLTDAAGTATLPATAAASVASRLQVLRNNVKQAFAGLAGKADDSAVVKLTGAQTVAGVKTFSDRSAHAGAYTASQQPAHNATPTFDCATGNVFEPAAMTGNVTSITLSNPAAGQTVQIRFQQDATGGRTAAVPSGAKVDGSINTAANRVSWLILTYSSRGARWEGNWLQVPA